MGLSLRPQIDFDGVKCLNEDTSGMGQDILKLHEERLSAEPYLKSQEDDPEILLHIPFTEAVTITKISIRSSPPSSIDDDFPTAPPRTVKVFSNRDDIDFEMARELTPHCQVDALPPEHFTEGTLDYPLRPAGNFRNIYSLTLFFSDNYGNDDEVSTVITYIGLKGRGSGLKRVAVECVYESQGMPKDHKIPGAEFGTQDRIG